jgi:hypothetical protein
MRKLGIAFTGLLLLALPALAGSDPNDVEGSSDYPLFGRMPNFHISSYDDKDFDAAEFASKEQPVTVEGRKITIYYRLNEGAKAPSNVEIQRNYRAVLKKAGAEIVHEDNAETVAKLTKDKQEVWFEVSSSPQAIDLTIVEQGEFKQKME